MRNTQNEKVTSGVIGKNRNNKRKKNRDKI